MLIPECGDGNSGTFPLEQLCDGKITEFPPVADFIELASSNSSNHGFKLVRSTFTVIRSGSCQPAGSVKSLIALPPRHDRGAINDYYFTASW